MRGSSPDTARFYSPSVALSTYTNITTNPIRAYTSVGRFSPDGSLFVCDNGNNAEKIFIYQTHGSADATTWTKLPALGQQPLDSLWTAEFSPDGQWLAVGHNTSPYVEVYNTATWTKRPAPATTVGGTAYSISFSPDSSMMAATGANLRVYNTSTMGLVPGVPSLSWPSWVRFSADGANLLTDNSSAPFIRRYETTGWTSQPIGAGSGLSYQARASSDGRWLAVQTEVGVDVWDAETWNRFPISILQFDGVSGSVGLSFSKDSKYFAFSAVTYAENLSIVDTSDWSLVYGATWPAGFGAGFCEFSPF